MKRDPPVLYGYRAVVISKQGQNTRLLLPLNTQTLCTYLRFSSFSLEIRAQTP